MLSLCLILYYYAVVTYCHNSSACCMSRLTRTFDRDMLVSGACLVLYYYTSIVTTICHNYLCLILSMCLMLSLVY